MKVVLDYAVINYAPLIPTISILSLQAHCAEELQVTLMPMKHT
jgi:hypothetical protein